MQYNFLNKFTFLHATNRDFIYSKLFPLVIFIYKICLNSAGHWMNDENRSLLNKLLTVHYSDNRVWCYLVSVISPVLFILDLTDLY